MVDYGPGDASKSVARRPTSPLEPNTPSKHTITRLSGRMCELRFRHSMARRRAQPQQCWLKPQQAHVAEDTVELQVAEDNLAADTFKLDQPTDRDAAG
jgi:hypothetical protein